MVTIVKTSSIPPENPKFAIVGKKFNKLLVLRKLPERDLSGNYYYECVCDCGKTIKKRKCSIIDTRHKGCGCVKLETGKKHAGFTGYEEIHGNTWTMIKKNARTRNISFTVSIETAWNLYLQQDRRCALTGVPIAFAKKIKSKRTASLDRIDSTKSYTADNIQWVHRVVNLMKASMFQPDFIGWCQAVANYAGNTAKPLSPSISKI